MGVDAEHEGQANQSLVLQLRRLVIAAGGSEASADR
jgi:hypothetical protein